MNIYSNQSHLTSLTVFTLKKKKEEENKYVFRAVICLISPQHTKQQEQHLSLKLIKPIIQILEGASKNKYLNTFRALTLSPSSNFTLERQAAYLNKQTNCSQV